MDSGRLVDSYGLFVGNFSDWIVVVGCADEVVEGVSRWLQKILLLMDLVAESPSHGVAMTQLVWIFIWVGVFCLVGVWVMCDSAVEAGALPIG